MGTVAPMEKETLHPSTPLYLPVGPLATLADRMQQNAEFETYVRTTVRSLCGKYLERELAKARKTGFVQLLTADRIACRLGVHPIFLWGEGLYFDPLGPEDVGLPDAA